MQTFPRTLNQVINPLIAQYIDLGDSSEHQQHFLTLAPLHRRTSSKLRSGGRRGSRTLFQQFIACPMNHRAFLYTGPAATSALKHVPLCLTHFPNPPVWIGGFTWPRLISVPPPAAPPSLPSAARGFLGCLQRSNWLLPALARQTDIPGCFQLWEQPFQGNTHYCALDHTWQGREAAKTSEQRGLPMPQALHETTLPPSTHPAASRGIPGGTKMGAPWSPSLFAQDGGGASGRGRGTPAVGKGSLGAGRQELNRSARASV